MKSVYRQFTEQVAADAALSAAAVPSPNPFTWLSGVWRWHGAEVRFTTAAYGIRIAEEPYLIHNAVSGMWLLVLADPDAYGLLIGGATRAAEYRFSGDVTIAGKSVRLRQSWHHIEADKVRITNERETSGQWLLWERALLERIKL